MTTVKEIKRALSGLSSDERLLSTKEFAEMYGYSHAGIRTLLKRRKIPGAFKIGEDWFIPENASIIARQRYTKNGTRLVEAK